MPKQHEMPLISVGVTSTQFCLRLIMPNCPFFATPRSDSFSSDNCHGIRVRLVQTDMSRWINFSHTAGYCPIGQIMIIVRTHLLDMKLLHEQIAAFPNPQIGVWRSNKLREMVEQPDHHCGDDLVCYLGQMHIFHTPC